MKKIAIAQVSSVLLNRQKSIDKAITLIEEAATEGAELIVFPEAFISGYPAWLWRLRPGADWSINETLYARLLENAINLDANELAPLCNAAKKNNITIVGLSFNSNL